MLHGGSLEALADFRVQPLLLKGLAVPPLLLSLACEFSIALSFQVVVAGVIVVHGPVVHLVFPLRYGWWGHRDFEGAVQ